MKAPAFQFYAADYLADEQVQLMTLEEEGAYIRLLSYCWREGSIPADEVMLSRLCKGAATTVVTVVKCCFNQHPTDASRLVHKRLEQEREKQKKWSEKSSDGGRKSAENKKLLKDNHPTKGGSTLHLLSSSSNNPISPFRLELEKAAAVIHGHHPDHRRDLGVGEITKKLTAILKHKKLITSAGKPLDEAIPFLGKVVAIHATKAKSEDWTKNNGDYAKGLANYLAPTMERYEQPAKARASPIFDDGPLPKLSIDQISPR